MPELLLEVGCEELPAVFVRKAYTDLLARVTATLHELYNETFDGVAFGTPRRLIISVPNIPAVQPDSIKEVRGPALKAAYDESGNPTGALQGFCRSNGVTLAELRKDDTYVWLTKTIIGLPTPELLADLLPKAVKGLTFEKSMRWGVSKLRFARPIRWILAAYDGQVVNFEIEGVRAGLESRGHRIYSPGTFKSTSLSTLLKGLRESKVEPDVELRAESIREQAIAVAGGKPDLPEELVEENAFLTEWPTAIAGEFRPEHLLLPAPVLTMAMAKHEKMFPIRDASGALVNRFIFIRNSGEDDSVRKGAEWVLNARLDDAQFFYREDSKHDLDYFLEKTSGIVFQEKLGTVREKSQRLEVLAGLIAGHVNGTEEAVANARAAGKFAKADLSSGLVGDMASLQGIVGGEYARRQGLPGPVCWAIATHYDHKLNSGAKAEESAASRCLALADNLDKLVGYLGIGLVPTGSSDPFGLRRATTALIEIALAWPEAAFNFKQLSHKASELYREAGKPGNDAGIESLLMDTFAARYGAIFPTARYDIVEAATHREDEGVLVPTIISARIRALELLSENPIFIQTATRPLNILNSAERKGAKFGHHGCVTDPKDDKPFEDRSDVYVTPAELDSAEGVALNSATHKAAQGIGEAMRLGSAQRLVDALQELEKPINAFFDSTMIMAEDAVTQFARLTLVKRVAMTLSVVGDFTKIVIEG